MDERYRTIKARFDSDCHWCGLPIKRGRTAHWNPVEKRIACSEGCILGLTMPKTYASQRQATAQEPVATD